MNKKLNKSENNNVIYSFFTIIALVFWNPLSFFLLYRNTAVYNSKILHLIYWIVFITGIVLVYLTMRKKIKYFIKNIIFFLSFAGILFSIMFAFNFMLSFTLNRETSENGIIFEPNTKAWYKTVEFDYFAEINSLGLRDKEIDIDNKDGKYRILCFGDSWTFGWGVDIEHSWPKKLEKFFHDHGITNIEVINCGQGGACTTEYRKNMAKAVPLLKPDLVLVGVLQGDDLFQLSRFNDTSRDFKYIRSAIRSAIKLYLKTSFGNIITLLRKPSRTIEIKENWENSAKNIINNFNFIQKTRFYTLDDNMQKLFLTGNLNPGLLEVYVNFPDRVFFLNNSNHPETIFCKDRMSQDIKDMKVICNNNNCNLVFVNLPVSGYTGHKVIRTPLDDLTSNYLVENNIVDSIYYSIATSNSLNYIELTDHFLSLVDKDKYFFLYDGHPNEKGYEEIANYIGGQLLKFGYLEKE